MADVKQAAIGPKEALYQDLKRSILTMKRAPGSDIDESTLAAEYGLSRTPLREVLRRMAGEGYLELRENRGAQVSAMTHNTLRDFFLVAPMIYAAATRLAARNVTAGQVALLRDVQRKFRAAVDSGNIEDRVFYNDRFHALIGEIANNIYLTPSLRRLLIDHARIADTFYQPRSASMRKNLAAAADQHDQMIAAIENGDEEAAAQLAIDHWALSRGMIEMFVTPKGLDAQLGSAAGS